MLEWICSCCCIWPFKAWTSCQACANCFLNDSLSELGAACDDEAFTAALLIFEISSADPKDISGSTLAFIEEASTGIDVVTEDASRERSLRAGCFLGKELTFASAAGDSAVSPLMLK